MATELEQLQEAVETAYAVLDEMVERLEAFADSDTIEEDELEMSDFIADDSALLHADQKRKYDPRKAHEYYMRTRKLKGRHQTSQFKTPKIQDYSKGEKLWLELSGGNKTLIELRKKHDNSENRKKIKELFTRLTTSQRVVGNVGKTVGQTAVKVPQTLASNYLTVISGMLDVFGADKASKSVREARSVID